MLDTFAYSRELNRIGKVEREIVFAHLSHVPVRLGAIASALGVEVLLSSLPTGISGMIQKVGEKYQIKINRNESKERQRFTLAHELSHFLLHKAVIDESADGIRDTVLYRSGAPATVEYEANRLAADLVMPPDAVEAEIESLGGEVTEDAIDLLAQRFGVSKAAMEIRVTGR